MHVLLEQINARGANAEALQEMSPERLGVFLFDGTFGTLIRSSPTIKTTTPIMVELIKITSHFRTIRSLRSKGSHELTISEFRYQALIDAIS